MTSLLPTQRKLPGGLGSLRQILLATLLGLVGGGGVLLVLAERRGQWAEARVVRAVKAREFTGPAPKPMKAFAGGDWVKLTGIASLPLKADVVPADPKFGAGYSTARGGPGSAWGPLGEAQNVPLPTGVWSGFNAPLARQQLSFARAVHPLAKPSAVPDPGFTKGTAVPHTLQYRDRNN